MHVMNFGKDKSWILRLPQCHMIRTRRHNTRTKGLKEAAYVTPQPRTRRSGGGKEIYNEEGGGVKESRAGTRRGGGSAARRMEGLAEEVDIHV